MSRRQIVLPSIQGVGVNQTATLEIPTVESYHKLQLLYGTGTAGGPTRANMEAEITEIRMKLNGKVQRRFSAADLFAINEYYGRGFTDGFLNIYLSEPWRRTAQGEDSLAWHMTDVSTFQLEIDIGAATAPTLAAKAIREPTPLRNDGRPVQLGAIVKWRKHTIQPVGAGEFNHVNLPKSDSYYGLFYNAVTINSVDVRLDERVFFEDATRADLAEIYADQGFVQPAGWTVVDFSPTARVADALLMRDPTGGTVKDFRLDLDFSAGGLVNMVALSVGTRD